PENTCTIIQEPRLSAKRIPRYINVGHRLPTPSSNKLNSNDQETGEASDQLAVACWACTGSKKEMIRWGKKPAAPATAGAGAGAAGDVAVEKRLTS
ncbi:unnamed protein product, partial [Urochloa humidicola]